MNLEGHKYKNQPRFVAYLKKIMV